MPGWDLPREQGPQSWSCLRCPLSRGLKYPGQAICRQVASQSCRLLPAPKASTCFLGDSNTAGLGKGRVP